MSKFKNTYESHMSILEEGKLKTAALSALAAGSLLGADVSKPSEDKPTKIVTQDSPKDDARKGKDIGEFLKLAKTYIGAYEGIKKYIYDDKHPNKKWKKGGSVDGNLTIGIGHLVKDNEIDKYIDGINDRQIQNLFNQDIIKHLRTTFKLFPKFNTYPTYIKLALLDSVYRGEMSSKHKTVKYINSGKWDKVPAEYINRSDYENAEADGMSGVKVRMDRKKDDFIKYAKSLKGK